MRLSLVVGIALVVAAFSLGEEKRRPFRIMSEQDHEKYLTFFPQSEDEWFNGLKERLVFYSEREVPRAYQHAGGVHSPWYNISANGSERFGNANREFPWAGPGGTDNSPGVKSLKFMALPEGKPIVWWNDTNIQGVAWTYPAETTFGEILTQPRPGGGDMTFEVRVRTKGKHGVWRPNVYRPFATRKELEDRVADLAPAEPIELALANSHPTGVFNRRGLYDYLPALPAATVDDLLRKTPFRPVLGDEWIRVGDKVGHAPSTKADYHIVPKNYDGPLLEVSTSRCMTCHDSVLKHADNFDAGRDWYGRVRGADGIFSFHPFDPSCISGNGFSVTPIINDRLVKAGLLKHAGQ